MQIKATCNITRHH